MKKNREDIIIFGRGWYYSCKKQYIEKHYHVIAILDNAVSGKVLGDVTPVWNPNLINELPEVPVLIMSNYYFVEMFYQLRALGINCDRILFGMNLEPSFDNSEKMLSLQGWHMVANKDYVQLECGESFFPIKSLEEYKRTIRMMLMDSQLNKKITTLPREPISRRFGLDYGTSVARYYIDRFIEENSDKIFGTVMEIGDARYTKRFQNKVEDSYVMHLEGRGEKGVIQGNLETGQIVFPKESLDCFICTQTIQMIYDIHKAVENIYLLLKSGGTAMVTLSGISQLSMGDYCEWGEYWRFTVQSAKKLFQEQFSEKDIKVLSYGNVKTAVALLYGICAEDIDEEDLNYNDIQYPVMISVIAIKR